MSNGGYYGHFVELQWSTSPWSSEQHAVVICPWNCSAPFVVGATCGGLLGNNGSCVCGPCGTKGAPMMNGMAWEPGYCHCFNS